jgi:KaiC/GvpD/RAD55 family RecA-like ATPase
VTETNAPDEKTMQDITIARMPTGISSLDPVLEGGAPPGSMILLIGEAGAGSYEFVYSSMANILNLKKTPPADPSLMLPSEIKYITFTRTKDEVKDEIAQSFHSDLIAAISEGLNFQDLSESYFDASVVPHDWYSETDIVTRLQHRSGREDILVHLSQILNKGGQNSLIVLDSITDLASQYIEASRWYVLAGFFRGLRRVSKRWNSNIYLLLTRGILKENQENELANIADAVLDFRWEETRGERRQRVMYFGSFRGVMPHLEEKDLVKFKVKVSAERGFEVESVRVVI